MRIRVIIAVVGLGIASAPLMSAADDLPATALRPSMQPPFDLSSSSKLTIPSPLDHTASLHTTPKAIVRFLRDEFKFQPDAELFGAPDRWQAPEEFLARRIGDCEDYALLAEALLRRNGIEAFALSVFGDQGYSHTVAVFLEEDGRYSVINQGKLRHVRAASLEALAAYLYPAWTEAAVVRQDGTRGRIEHRIVNHHLGDLDELAGLPF
jgi:hypothetical protein